MDFRQIYVKSYDNYSFNIESIKKYLKDTIKNKNKKHIEDVIEREIVSELRKRYSDEETLQRLMDNSNSFEDLIKEIGLFERYKDTVMFLDHEKYKVNADSIVDKAKEQGKGICLSSSLIVDYFF